MQRWSKGAAGRIRATVSLMLLMGLLAAWTAPAALALEGSSLQQELESTKAEETKTTETSSTGSSSSESGNSHKTILIAAGAAVVLLCGIAFVIVRDARRVAPATEGDIAGVRSGRDTAVMMRRRRAKAKAARQQRKRNR